MSVEACAIEVNGAEDIQFVDCAVEHIGTSAFWFRKRAAIVASNGLGCSIWALLA